MPITFEEMGTVGEFWGGFGPSEPTQFEQLAIEALDRVVVGIHPPEPTTGEAWDCNEAAWLRVNVINTSGLPLRDVVLRLSASGMAYVVHNPWMDWDDTWHWDSLEPGEAQIALFRLQAGNQQGNVFIEATLSAEVVPFVAQSWARQRQEFVRKT